VTKLTPKQEAFAKAYVETSNASEAYRRSYSTRTASVKTINEAASRVLADGKVYARVRELIERAAKRHDTTVDSLVCDLNDVFAKAMTGDRPQLPAAVSAVMGKAKLLGFDVQKIDLKGELKLNPMDDLFTFLAAGAGRIVPGQTASKAIPVSKPTAKAATKGKS
jgi:hypothetical protein